MEQRTSVADLARFVLDRLATAMGDASRAAAADPGILARIDQYAAAIVELLDPAARRPTRVALASYADGLRDTAAAMGWHAPRGDINWRHMDEITLRLVAVCLLARRADVGSAGLGPAQANA